MSVSDDEKYYAKSEDYEYIEFKPRNRAFVHPDDLRAAAMYEKGENCMLSGQSRCCRGAGAERIRERSFGAHCG
jgi:hypothetical protein